MEITNFYRELLRFGALKTEDINSDTMELEEALVEPLRPVYVYTGQVYQKVVGIFGYIYMPEERLHAGVAVGEGKYPHEIIYYAQINEFVSPKYAIFYNHHSIKSCSGRTEYHKWITAYGRDFLCTFVELPRLNSEDLISGSIKIIEIVDDDLIEIRCHVRNGMAEEEMEDYMLEEYFTYEIRKFIDSKLPEWAKD